eukprot:s7_g10.t1
MPGAGADVRHPSRTPALFKGQASLRGLNRGSFVASRTHRERNSSGLCFNHLPQREQAQKFHAENARVEKFQDEVFGVDSL